MNLELITLAAKAGLAGYTLGAPRQGRSEFKRCVGYDPIPGRMAPAEPLEIWMAWARHLELGRPPQTLNLSLDQFVNLNDQESAFGQLHVKNGLSSPLAGALENPVRNGSSAIARAAFWGLAFHGNPNRASEYAYYDASLDHAEEGVWIPVAVAATISCADSSRSFADLANIFLNFLPAASKVNRAVTSVSQMAKSNEGAREFRLKSKEILQEADILHAAHSGAHFLLSLLAAHQNSSQGLLTAVSLGGATAHVGATIAIITALQSESFAKEWFEPLGNTYVSSYCLRQISAPNEWQDWLSNIGTAWESNKGVSIEFQPQIEPESHPETNDITSDQTETLLDTKEFQPEDSEHIQIVETAETESPVEEIQNGDSLEDALPTPDSEIAESTSKQDAESELVTENLQSKSTPIQPDPYLSQLLDQSDQITWIELGQHLASIRFLNQPHTRPGQSLELEITLINKGQSSINGDVKLSAPNGWEIATKVDVLRLDPELPTKFLAIVRPDRGPHISNSYLGLQLNEFSANVPLILATPWAIVAPFPNPDGLGFERQFPPEREFQPDQVMNGRSDMPVHWSLQYLPRHIIETEPFFNSGPGVMFLYADLEFERPARISCVILSGIGAKVWTDGRLALSYHDKRQHLFDPNGRHVATFDTDGRTKLLIKTMRDSETVAPLNVVFYDEDGNIVQPRFHHIELPK